METDLADEQVAESVPNDVDAEAVDEAAEQAAALAIAPQPSAITARRRGDFEEAQMKLIKATVAKDASDGELMMFLEICARYDLDPFAKQIWCARMGGSSGPVTIMVSRDGLLSLANRPGTGFQGMDGDVVRENDDFEKTHGPNGIEIRHTVTDGSTEGRGKIVGAWAVVHRANRRPTYFYAPFEQYKREGKTPWAKQTDAMILKVAESMALRKAFSISGVVGEDEIQPQLLTARSEASTPTIEWPEDPELKNELEMAFNVLGYTKAKQRLSVNGKSEDELRDLLAKLNVEADAQAEEVEGEAVK